jgi:hypothetical protein
MIETRFGIKDTLLNAARTQSTRDLSNSFCEPNNAACNAAVAGATGSSSSSSSSGGSKPSTRDAVIHTAPVSTIVMAVTVLGLALSALLL